jgi:winged helix DNA-binding protein
MPGQELSRRALNRALLARQLLLRRAPLPSAGGPRADQVIATIEHLVGMQAQAPFPSYYGLWSRLAGFRPADLAGLIASRRVVRIGLMRGTIHLVSAADCLLLRPLIQPVLDRGFRANFGRRLPGVELAALAEAGRAAVEQPRTFSELGTLLAARWPGRDQDALAQAIRALVPLVQVPPRALWGAAGPAAHTSAESWLGQPLQPDPSPDALVTRYLSAFGPASVQDIQAWSGLTRLREVVDRLRPQLRAFTSSAGSELFDLPGAARPDPAAPAPVRLVAEFDNLILSHADRTRVISDAHRRRLASRNGIFPGTVLVDGFASGAWRIVTARSGAVLRIEPHWPWPRPWGRPGSPSWCRSPPCSARARDCSCPARSPSSRYWCPIRTCKPATPWCPAAPSSPRWPARPWAAPWSPSSGPRRPSRSTRPPSSSPRSACSASARQGGTPLPRRPQPPWRITQGRAPRHDRGRAAAPGQAARHHRIGRLPG